MVKTKEFILGFTLFALANQASAAKSEIERNNMTNSPKAFESLDVYFGSSFANRESDLDKANLFNVKIGVDGTKKLSRNLNFAFKSHLNLETGNSDSFIGESEFTAKNGFSLKKAEFIYAPIENLDLKAGAISMGDYNHGLLISNRAFLGLKQQFKLKLNKVGVELSSAQTIPNNQNLSNKLDGVDEGTPKFFIENLKVSYNTSRSEFSSSTSHFAFDNLSESVAAKSLIFGNSVDKIDDSSGEFLYSYIGWAQSFNGRVNFSSFGLSADAQYLINTAAASRNTANNIGIGIHHIVEDKEISFNLNKFRTESDASVAYYNSLKYGHSNRDGYSAGLSFKNLKNLLEVGIQYSKNTEINENQLAVKDEDEVILVNFGKTYDIF